MNHFLIMTLGVSLIISGCSSSYQDHGHGSDGHHGTTMGNHNQMDEGQNHGISKHHMSAGHAHGSERSMAGEPGKESQVTRVINVTADDTMRFSLDSLNVIDGETIRFVVTNKGAIPHEFSIGTKAEHKVHGSMMMENPNMHHGPGGNSITINPAETQELIWKFHHAQQVEAACNIPGHYQAGMYSPVIVTEK